MLILTSHISVAHQRGHLYFSVRWFHQVNHNSSGMIHGGECYLVKIQTPVKT